MYKLMTNILINMLKPLIPILIYQNENGFIQGMALKSIWSLLSRSFM